MVKDDRALCETSKATDLGARYSSRVGVKHMKSDHFSADGRFLESALVPGYRWDEVAMAFDLPMEAVKKTITFAADLVARKAV